MTLPNHAFAARARHDMPPMPGKPRLSAWQRWEMNSLEADALAAHAAIETPRCRACRPGGAGARGRARRLRHEARATGEAEGRAPAGRRPQGRTRRRPGCRPGRPPACTPNNCAHSPQRCPTPCAAPKASWPMPSSHWRSTWRARWSTARCAEPEWVLPLVRDLLQHRARAARRAAPAAAPGRRGAGEEQPGQRAAGRRLAGARRRHPGARRLPRASASGEMDGTWKPAGSAWPVLRSPDGETADGVLNRF
jgi:flagellar assembly protein FliH